MRLHPTIFACMSLLCASAWASDMRGTSKTSDFQIMGGRMSIVLWSSGCWEISYQIPGNLMHLSYYNDDNAWYLDGDGDDKVIYPVPENWTATITFHNPSVVFGKNKWKSPRFNVPAGNQFRKIVADEKSMRAVVSTQTDNATFVIQLFDLKNGNIANIDLTPLEKAIDENWPKSEPEDFIGHAVWQGGILNPAAGKPGFAIGTPYMAGTIGGNTGDFSYTLHLPYFINLRQPWPEEGKNAVLTVGKPRLEKEPDPNPQGKAPR